MKLSIWFFAISALIYAEDKLPSAEAILDKYVAATGGREAYAKVHNSVATGTMEIVGQGVKGTMTVYSAEPAKMYSTVDIAGVGKIEEGTDGNIAWSNSAIQGPRIKQGEERALALRSADLKNRVEWKDSYKNAETVGVDTVDGKPCYKVVLTPREGKPEINYYEKDSGLLVRQTTTVKTPMGDIPVDASIGDYRSDSGILMPHVLKQSVEGQQLLLTFSSIRFNAEIPANRFELPPEIKALMSRKEK